MEDEKGSSPYLLDAAFRSLDGKAGFDNSLWFNGSLLDARFSDGPNLYSSNKAETRAILFARKEARAQGF